MGTFLMKFGAGEKRVRLAAGVNVGVSEVFAEISGGVFTVRLAGDHAEVSIGGRAFVRRFGEPEERYSNIDTVLCSLVPSSWLSRSVAMEVWAFARVQNIFEPAAIRAGVPVCSLAYVSGYLRGWYDLQVRRLEDSVVPIVRNDYEHLPGFRKGCEYVQTCRHNFGAIPEGGYLSYGHAQDLRMNIFPDRFEFQYKEYPTMELLYDTDDQWEWEVLRVLLALFPFQWSEKLVPDLRDFAKARGIYDRERDIMGVYPYWWSNAQERIEALFSERKVVEDSVEEISSEVHEVVTAEPLVLLYDIRKDRYDTCDIDTSVLSGRGLHVVVDLKSYDVNTGFPSVLHGVKVAGFPDEVAVGNWCWLDLLHPNHAFSYFDYVFSKGITPPAVMDEGTCLELLRLPPDQFRNEVRVAVRGRDVHVSLEEGPYLMHGFAFLRALLLINPDVYGENDVHDVFLHMHSATCGTGYRKSKALDFLDRRIREVLLVYGRVVDRSADLVLMQFFRGTLAGKKCMRGFGSKL